MAVLVDAAVWPFRGERWAHLVSDTSLDELHEFAQRLGKRRLAFQGDHYDVEADDRLRAIQLGAEAVDARELLARLTRAGLRRRDGKPRWERLGTAPVGSPLLAPESLGPAGGRLRAAVESLASVDQIARSAVFADESRAVVLFDWIGDPVTVPVASVDEVWAGAPRRDGERSLELFVRRETSVPVTMPSRSEGSSAGCRS